PRGHQRHHAERLALGPAERRRQLRRHRLAVEPPPFARLELEVVDRLLHFAERLAERLAFLERERARQLLFALGHLDRRPRQHFAAPRRRRTPPRRQRSLGRGDGALRVFAPAHHHVTERLPRRRIHI